LVPLLATVAVSTVAFTLAGLQFGEMLGERFRENAERAAGVVLVALAIFFALNHGAG
jgi:putative Mn2+ efflux pump MntP